MFLVVKRQSEEEVLLDVFASSSSFTSSWRRPTTPSSIPTRTAACASTRPRRKPSRISRTCSNGTETANTRARSSRRKTRERVRRRRRAHTVLVCDFFFFLSRFLSRRPVWLKFVLCANVRVVGRRRRKRRRLEDGLAFVASFALLGRRTTPFLFFPRRRRRVAEEEAFFWAQWS